MNKKNATNANTMIKLAMLEHERDAYVRIRRANVQGEVFSGGVGYEPITYYRAVERLVAKGRVIFVPARHDRWHNYCGGYVVAPMQQSIQRLQKNSTY